MNIKTTLTAATLVALTSPAFGKTTQHSSRNQMRPVDAYATVYPNVRTPRASRGSNDVYDVRGIYIGSDPDGTIRDQLARDPSQGD
jgi:hypothetical protein